MIGRRSFVAATVVTLAAACGSSGGDRKRETRPERRPSRGVRRLAQKGVNYDTGSAYMPAAYPGVLTREVWRPEYVRRELEAIREDLHCNAIFVIGSDHDRLVETAALAADLGLFVWLEPQVPDATAEQTTALLAAVAGAAEQIRADHPDIGMGLGCELSLFMTGPVPGATWQDRMQSFYDGWWGDIATPLNAFMAGAATEIRRSFGGPLTYSSGPWEPIDWAPLDMVGVDMYRDSSNATTFADDVAALHEHGKPVLITEFGCCAYDGAAERGGDGWDIVDESAPAPIPAGYERDEKEQADYIDDLLGIFDEARMHGAFVYDFIEPDAPHSSDPRHDQDMASYSIVKCHGPDHPDAYATTGTWEPKRAFEAVARRYRG